MDYYLDQGFKLAKQQWERAYDMDTGELKQPDTGPWLVAAGISVRGSMPGQKLWKVNGGLHGSLIQRTTAPGRCCCMETHLQYMSAHLQKL